MGSCLTLENEISFLNEQITKFESTIEMETALVQLMEGILKNTNASRVQLTRFRNGIFSHECHCEKDGTHVSHQLEDQYACTPSDVWVTSLQKNQILQTNDIHNFDLNVQEMHLNIFSNAFHAFTAIPVIHESQLIAVITICDGNSDKIKAFLQIKDVLCTWLSNRIVKNDNRALKTISGLGIDYTAAYMINLDTDYFEVIINQKTNHSAKVKKVMKWTDYLCGYADTYCIDTSAEPMKTELCTKTLKQRFETKDEFHFVFETIPNDKNQTTFQAHAVKEYGSEGNYAVLGFRCVDEIIKKEREYQKALDNMYQLAAKQLDIISNAIPGGIKISNDDPTYSFKYVSEQYANMLGYESVDEFMQASGGSIVGIAHPEDLETGIREALRQYQTSDHYAITYRMRCKDGSYKYIEDHGHKVINEDGVVEHWNLILDKNELVEKTIALETEKQANIAKTQFLSRMSHDIRTPLNGIIGLLQIDAQHPDNLSLISENRKKAQVAADHLLSLINDILELNKLSDQEVILYEEVCDVKKMMEEVITIIAIKAEDAKVNLHVSSKHELSHPYIYGSPLHIQQIFINVITNAIKYNHAGGSVDCILEEADAENDKVTYVVQVKDTGIGMSKEYVASIFEPFSQEKQDARSIYQGTGLGMSIVKNLVDRMGGNIAIESEEGKGTCVTITLTFKIAERIREEKEKIAEMHASSLKGKQILLAEDNPLNRDIASFILKDEGMIVSEAKNGKEAVNLYQSHPAGYFDIILMDVMMPVLSGYEATKKIRSSSKADAKTIPIFALTANAFSEDRKQSEESGMNEHISKPINAKELMEKIQKYVMEKEWKNQ